VDDLVSAPALLYKPLHPLPEGAPDCGLLCNLHAKNQVTHPDARDRIVPLHICPNRCSGRGFCFANEECRCFQLDDSAHWDAAGGADCSMSRESKPCLNRCSGKGECFNGVCTCVAGRSGVDCSLPLGHAPQRPTVYVYELPPAFNVWQDLVAIDRNLGWLLWQALLTSPHRTSDPTTADFFFIPVYPMGTVGLDTTMLAFDYVIEHFPFWNNTSGHNHLAVAPYDFGFCQIGALTYFDRIRMISHYGLTAGGPAFCREGTGGPSYRRNVDLLVPDTMEQSFKRASPYLRDGDPWADRPTTFFFAGSRTGAARSQLFDMNMRHSGVRIVEGHVDLALEMRRSVYCGDFGAAGFSTRFTLALVMGCVPVFLDELKPAWTDVLPIDSFAVRLSQHDFVNGRLNAVLEAVSAQQLLAMREAGRNVWRFYIWPFLLDVGNENALSLFFARLDAFIA
jgi:hypothetical protein